MKQTFYSNGKLLITGEYLVLDGAKALALPTKFGQSMHISPGIPQNISWTSYDSDGTVWFESTFTFEEIKSFQTLEKGIKKTLFEILSEAHKLNPEFLSDSKGYVIETHLTFPKNWGLGTSSTLLANIAKWLEINPFQLLKNSFGGSGYDIACAQNDTAILYELRNELPYFTAVDFYPIFHENLYFLYLNQKQSSKTAIATYLGKQKEKDRAIIEINQITAEILTTNSIQTFALAIDKHESLMSNILEMHTVKEALFQDFKGVIKSLGAWGGDFVLVVSKENPKKYFEEKGYATLLSFSEMIL
ncbi:GYDIA family GHMP kinase [Flavobacterium sp. UBA6135]|uniref:GYDIA family GHMP kinase n=1 Tax=Flavobacterium sp. UBA6135 TaxID=1946553 RepID=UPI0025C6FBB0|nr:GYDIA family GHMP kinase [Flavobacterium sp. UBA6135]